MSGRKHVYRFVAKNFVELPASLRPRCRGGGERNTKRRVRIMMSEAAAALLTGAIIGRKDVSEGDGEMGQWLWWGMSRCIGFEVVVVELVMVV